MSALIRTLNRRNHIITRRAMVKTKRGIPSKFKGGKFDLDLLPRDTNSIAPPPPHIIRNLHKKFESDSY